MELITTPETLYTLCQKARTSNYLALDTEFIQDKHYYPKLCLIQVATDDLVAAIDPLAFGIELWSEANREQGPVGQEKMQDFWNLLREPQITKVFHAARNDLEIFFRLMGEVPQPVFDSQVAAMVCGHGDTVSYLRLVQDICKKSIAKSSRLYHWDKRPIEMQKLAYALNDVTYLRDIYKSLKAKLIETGRESWIEEEMQRIVDPTPYTKPPQEAWKHISIKEIDKGNFERVKLLSAWREGQAQRVNLPRRYVMRDIDLLRLASLAEKNLQDESDIPNDISIAKHLKTNLLNYIRKEANTHATTGALDQSDSEKENIDFESYSESTKSNANTPQGIVPILELFRVLLSQRAHDNGVAHRLIATPDDLRQLAHFGENADSRLLIGWRADLFGRDALRLMKGEAALTIDTEQYRHGDQIVQRRVVALIDR